MNCITVIEKLYVKSVYQEIAEHFSDTRYCVWDMVSNFLKNKTPNELGLEIGCGNGKNLMVNPNLKIIGIDNCSKLIDICLNKNLNVLEACCCSIPFDNNHFDFVMSIAVFHHLSTDERRILAVNEMVRVTKKKGKGLISLWSMENQENEKIKRKFKEGDNVVSWTRNKDQKIFNRYYYIFTYEKIINLINKTLLKDTAYEIYNQRGNWVIEYQK